MTIHPRRVPPFVARPFPWILVVLFSLALLPCIGAKAQTSDPWPLLQQQTTQQQTAAQAQINSSTTDPDAPVDMDQAAPSATSTTASDQQPIQDQTTVPAPPQNQNVQQAPQNATQQSQTSAAQRANPRASSDAAGAAAASAGAQQRPAANQATPGPADLRMVAPQAEQPAPGSTDEQASPYRSVESLRDLYTRIPSKTEKLRRFGSDVFTLGTGNANQLPSDLPAGPDYVLGPGDQLTVNLWGGRSARLSATVDRQGEIALPEAGTVAVDGLTIAQAQAQIQTALNEQFRDEHVEISLGRVRTVRVYVVGDVQRPGAYDVSSLSTPLNVLYAAGGPTARGSLRIVRQLRGKQLVREIDLYDFLLHGIRSSVDRLQPGDTLLVPPAGPEVAVEGMVRRPAIYELNGETSLKQVLDLAGGVLETGSLKQINVERVQAHQRRTMVSINLPTDATESNPALAAFHVQAGDDVVISQILPYNEQAVFLQGHVFRPGKYPFHEGMTFTDLVHSYQDVLPEPSDHAEIIRLVPPDYRPETISVDLHDALIGNEVIHLQPFDLVHIFGRYEYDAPRVSIEGEVLRPGVYPLTSGLTLNALINMAGGFRRSAYTQEAGLSSYTVVDGKNVLLNQTVVPLSASLTPNQPGDVLLKPGDVVSIRMLAGWQDIGSSIVVAGEVEHAGTYGIQAGEHLSSVLRRAGGFRATAYPEGSVLTRVQVREIQENDRQNLIQRIESTPVLYRGSATGEDVAAMQQQMQNQRAQILASLRAHPPNGRQVIDISGDISKWEGTPNDIELRAGDRIFIPKLPQFVVIAGEAYNPDAITFVPGKTAGWYLNRAGGVTHLGDKKHVFVVRADGSVVAHGGGWNGALDTRLRPGDSVIVPEKLIGTSEVWKNILAAGQIAASLSLTAAVAGAF